MSTSNGLRARVVYESLFGNTEWVARAVAEGLRLEGLDVTVGDVRDTSATDDHNLLVVGAPTHAFSLSRASTRQDAVKQGAPPETASTGLREWITALATPAHDEHLVAAFDTRVRKVRHLPAAASRKAAHLLTKKGFELVVPPHGFLVEDVAGPLSEGQLQEATAWGRKVAVDAQHRLAAGVR
jgi:flavodoxin